MDTQQIRAANHEPAATTGMVAGKKVSGRKRGLAVDAAGLILAVVVTAASVIDNAIGIRLLDNVAARTPTVSRAWVDAGFKQDVALHGAVADVDVEVGKRFDTGVRAGPQKRAIVEQVNGTMILLRRLARENERRPESSVYEPRGRRRRTSCAG
ncbi:transposase [Micromonospora sp. NPDC005324]|uniref:transposase n=1 Tax=Micromonospora sp. NPDC005324 TaxID=3157033 RepID=UPI0033A0BA9F